MAQGATIGCVAMSEITQRDLRSRSREIMDAVERGESFIVTRDGRRIGALIPLRHRRRFVSREEFGATSRNAPDADLDAFRADQKAADHDLGTTAYSSASARNASGYWRSPPSGLRAR
jgi:prevent-host-death family protein